MLLRALYGCIILRDKEGEDKGGGGGAGTKTETADPKTGEELSALKASNDALKAEIEALKSKQPKTLNERVTEDQKGKAEIKALESALRFNLQAPNFLKDNEALLPKSVAEIFKVAEKQNYDTDIQKADDIKLAIVEKFFEVQENLDLLTATHKISLEEFRKLTKNGKEARVQSVYENIFEPALERLRSVKKAEEVGRAKNGLGNPSDAESAYKNKLIEASKKQYLKERK